MIWRHDIKAKGQGVNTIRCYVDYSKDSHCYYLSVRPMMVEHKDGYCTETYGIGWGAQGKSFRLNTVSRRSKKAEETAIALADARLVECVEHVLEMNEAQGFKITIGE